MHNIRLIAMDMDGTLLSRVSPTGATIPEENRAVLQRCQRAGIHLALASGRLPDDASFFALDAGLNMHIIGLNGGVILPSPMGKPVYERFLPEDTARGVTEILAEAGVDVVAFGLWEAASLRSRSLTWARHELGSYFGREGGRLRYRTGRDAVQELMQGAGKIVALTENDREGLARAKERILARYPEASVTSSWWNNFEVNPAGTDKGSALRRLADTLGIPMHQVMAIGDNDNDASMLHAAGVGVAMGNATQAARDAATHATLTNEEMGVAAAIRALVFGEEAAGVAAIADRRERS